MRTSLTACSSNCAWNRPKLSASATLHHVELFHANRRHVYRATQRSRQQKVTHLFGNSECNTFLRLGG